MARSRKRLRATARRFGCGAILALILLLLVRWLTWPDVARLAEKPPETTAFIDSTRAHREVDWRWVRYPAISNHLKHAVLVAEDIDFFSHSGFAVEEIQNALRDTVFEGKRLRGASTLTQQLAKNLWLSGSRNPLRKLEEAVLTRQLEQQLEKRRILEIYLNVVEFGPGIFGCEAAAQHYFNKPAARLGPRQAAKLAASLPAPKRQNPNNRGKTYDARVERIISRMSRATWIKAEL